jgi:hypothetical protein
MTVVISQGLLAAGVAPGALVSTPMVMPLTGAEMLAINTGLQQQQQQQNHSNTAQQ